MSRRRGEWRHGYDLLQDTGLSSGTLYPLLIWMTDKGLVEADWREPLQQGRPPRHVYRLTMSGFVLALEPTGDSIAPMGKEIAA